MKRGKFLGGINLFLVNLSLIRAHGDDPTAKHHWLNLAWDYVANSGGFWTVLTFLAIISFFIILIWIIKKIKERKNNIPSP